MSMDKFTNKLISEKSPYLQQHAHNPVNWYPWCDEAFHEAKSKNKPIFLSIGYSTCHWCHVMEHECFEDNDVARIMNETFISIKVDREERPDLDSFYMKICQLMTGSGGWPLNIIMSPDKVPFLALTYIPKESRGDQIGLIELTERIRDVWQEKKDALIRAGSEAVAELMRTEAKKPAPTISTELRNKTFTELSSMFDETNGGFGSRPKFPTPHNVMFLFRVFASTGDEKALQMATKTLLSMSLGGIHDHIGGGFHRYSTDENWIIPHFEKMAYDQALLAMAYMEAYQLSHNDVFREIAISTLNFLISEMKSPEGGFYSAIDADSEGEEGKFYVWKYSEILDVLGENDGKLFSDIFHATPQGNHIDDSSGRDSGTNVLYLERTIEEEARNRNIDPTEFRDKVKSMIVKLREYRHKRIAPSKDRKILCDINGLIITALVRGYKSLGLTTFLEHAIDAEKFLRERLLLNGVLHHSYVDDFVSPPAFLDDYANVIQGELELFTATGNVDTLKFVLRLMELTDKLFEDVENGGYFLSTTDETGNGIRLKEAYDGAVPSGNSVHMLNLLRMSLIMGDQNMLFKSKRVADAFNSEIVRGAPFHCYMMIAVDYAVSRNFLVTIPESYPDASGILKDLWTHFNPHAELVILGKSLSEFLAESNHVLGNGNNNRISICTRTECMVSPENVEDIVNVLTEK